ncbi:MAG: PKD domain-containing protein, partial [Eudoraea sp.]|nr:PKD domain-containing protein [Eudoraea sp.]
FTGSNSTDDTGVVSYFWDFGDGAVSASADPSHTFTTAGDFNVDLTVTDGAGLSDTTSVTISVSAPNQPPVAVISATPLSGEAPLDVNFTGSNSTDDTGVVSYAWDFGDGAVSTSADPSHTFTSAGDFNVDLTVTDGAGLSDTTSVTISVTEATTNQPPVAVINATPLSGEYPLEVTFTGSNSTDDTGVVSYFWDFGDGAYSMATNPVHIYKTTGEFVVELSVTDGNELSNSAFVTITVDKIANNMIVLLMENPSKLGMSKIQILDKPSDVVVRAIYLHDTNGRLVQVYNPQNVITDTGYELPVYRLENGIYFITLVMNQRDPLVLKLIVRN